jgi:hypothetical protein
MMLQWQRDNGHKNDNAGRAAFSETLHAIHPDIDYLPKQTSTGRDRRTTPGAAEEESEGWYAARLRGYLAMHGAFGWPPFP